MRSPEARAARWLGVVGDLLKEPVAAFPYGVLSAELAATFDVHAVSWNWGDPDGSFGFEIFPPNEVWRSEDFLSLWLSGELVALHPLTRWMAETRDPAPQSIGRVPTSVVSRRESREVTDLLKPFGTEQQMSVPYRMSGAEQRHFLLARPGRDFSDDDLEVAHLLQPVFGALDRQAHILARAMPPPTQARARDVAGLTGRELAVLSLLAEGHTAFSISRRLATSPRTVHKHLQHIYSKLHARDRLTAVRTAQALDLISDRGVPEEPASRAM
jgi:DNA-binding CsgD family transcriptional regulator